MPGRGGAGNILAVQQQNQRVASDLESNQRSPEQALNPSSADLPPPRQDQQYAHSGRGGAGNYYSPKELMETGRYVTNLPSEIGAGPKASSNNTAGGSSPASSGTGENATSQPVRRYGRGGAGNMSFGVTEDEERMYRTRREEEEQKREQLKADVEANVKATLAEPPKAKLSGADPY